MTADTCRRGHPRNDTNTYRNRNGKQKCRICAAANARHHRGQPAELPQTGQDFVFDIVQAWSPDWLSPFDVWVEVRRVGRVMTEGSVKRTLQRLRASGRVESRLFGDAVGFGSAAGSRPAVRFRVVSKSYLC